MSLLQELSEMDRLTQLQDSIDELLTVMSSSIHYLITRADFEQLNPDIPITKSRGDKAASPEEFEATKKDLVNSLVMQAKKIEILIRALPAPVSEQQQVENLAELRHEMEGANREYRAAVQRASELHAEFTKILGMMLEKSPSRPG
ncbi:uncharacterized protein EI90DRAFT_3155481 [Cantharellus anzutake]|uniref:uncharacterized protein n=1 Tax=Cantharellus anzutake TaxID=1750568 RepID=UPI001906840C|nr:uncharacterized protein EI90DRAFT_3155481 [Cantharellus anzutake]KAF8329111.1 hypothetical protein EI90DRAFT_3155481 [Cantharellus anzutake]